MSRQCQLTARTTTLGYYILSSSVHAAHIMYPIEGARHDVVRADVSCNCLSLFDKREQI